MKKELVLNKKQTMNFAKDLAKQLLSKKILCLKGDLGAGKTFLSSCVIKELLEDNSLNITSPSFSIVNLYNTKNGKAIYHFDLYRIKDETELENIGFFDAITNEICIIEWWENAGEVYKKFLQNALFIDINYLDSKTRRYYV